MTRLPFHCDGSRSEKRFFVCGSFKLLIKICLRWLLTVHVVRERKHRMHVLMYLLFSREQKRQSGSASRKVYRPWTLPYSCFELKQLHMLLEIAMIFLTQQNWQNELRWKSVHLTIEFAMIIAYPTSASGLIVKLKSIPKYRKLW